MRGGRIDYNHPDLKANMWVNPGEIAGNGIDDDGNGYVDGEILFPKKPGFAIAGLLCIAIRVRRFYDFRSSSGWSQPSDRRLISSLRPLQMLILSRCVRDQCDARGCKQRRPHG